MQRDYEALQTTYRELSDKNQTMESAGVALQNELKAVREELTSASKMQRDYEALQTTYRELSDKNQTMESAGVALQNELKAVREELTSKSKQIVDAQVQAADAVATKEMLQTQWEVMRNTPYKNPNKRSRPQKDQVLRDTGVVWTSPYNIRKQKIPDMPAASSSNPFPYQNFESYENPSSR
jgi:chromosome segregation ATPase